MNRRQQRHRHAQPQHPAERGEQRHVHVIEHEHLVAQHRQPIEVFRAAPGARSSPTDACSRATCDSSAIVTLSRKRRCTRVLTVRRNQVAAADTPRPIGGAAHQAGPVLEHALAEQHQPQREQRVGQRGELRQHERDEHQPRLVAVAELAQPPHRRQRRRQRLDRAIAIRRGRHRSSPPLRLDVEALRLQIEHRPVAAAERHQLVVRAELDDAAVLEHADAIGVADGREAVRDQDRGAVPRRGEQAIEDLGFAAHVELRGRLVEQHDAGAERDRAQRPGERDALPLAARTDRCRRRSRARARCRAPARFGRAGRLERRAHDVVGRAGGRDVVAQRQLEADEVLEHRRDARSPRREIELAQVDAVDLDRAGLRIVEAAQQLRERRLAGAVLADDGERRAGGNREVEVLRGRGGAAAGIRERHVAEADLARGHAAARAIARAAARRPAASPARAAAPPRPAPPRRRAPS